MSERLRQKLRRWIDRGNAYFIENWRVLPFQPILYLFLFTGALLVLGLDVDHPTFDSDFTFFWWISLSLLCPPMAFAAWVLIKYRPGMPRYWGLYLRLGADVGQLASISAFLTIVANDIDPIAAELYSAEIFAAVWWFLVALVVRDLWKLVLTERVAAALDRADVEDGEEG